jgi:hypothetical protein
MTFLRRLALLRTRAAAVGGALMLAGIGILLPGEGFASVVSKTSKAAAPVPPKTCGTEATYNSAAYSLAGKVCLQVAQDPMGAYIVYATGEVKFTNGNTPISYCRAEFEGVKGQGADLPDGGGFVVARCTSAASKGAVFKNSPPDGAAVGYVHTFPGGTYTGRMTILVGTDKGTIRNVVATYTTNIPAIP